MKSSFCFKNSYLGNVPKVNPLLVIALQWFGVYGFVYSIVFNNKQDFSKVQHKCVKFMSTPCLCIFNINGF